MRREVIMEEMLDEARRRLMILDEARRRWMMPDEEDARRY